MKFIYTIFCLLLLMQAQATVRRVRASNPSSGSGSSWSQAYMGTQLQAVINMSVAGDEVWVSRGIYTLAGTNTYSMKSGVKIYGGFSATVDGSIERNWKLYKTFLEGNYSNSVITNNGVNNQAVLDGVIIMSGADYYGGGIYSANSSPQISNCIITGNTAYSGGGGVYNYSGNPSFTNVIIQNNSATNSSYNGNGGGVYNDESSPTLTNVVIANNYSDKDGGGIYSYADPSDAATIRPTLINSLVVNNEAHSGAGGGIFGFSTAYKIINCTFFGNTCYINATGAGLHNYGPGNSVIVTSTVTNTIFWLNRTTQNGNYYDVVNSRAAATISYTLMVLPPAGNGNVSPVAPPLFIDVLNPAGPDGEWMTADDGVRLSPCNGGLAVDKGDNAAISGVTTDILGNPRRVNNGLIADGGSGTAPIVDMGAYEEQTTITATQLAGTIGHAHLVPNPQELRTDSVANVIAPQAGLSVIRWEKSTNSGSTWTTTTPAGTLNYYRFSDSAAGLNLTTTTQFRRVASSSAYCDIPYATAPVEIRVTVPNGQITGKVTSTNGTTGIPGVTIKVTRTGRTPISGASLSKVYTATTDGGGNYTVEKIYYGDPDPALPSVDTFRIVPQKTNHLFDPAVFNGKVLTSATPQPSFSPVDFKDTTALLIRGTVWQKCTTCTVIGTVNTATQTCPLDSVKVATGTTQFFTQKIGTGGHGQYTLTVTDPGLITVTPTFMAGQHRFDPPYISEPIQESVAGKDFYDTTTHVISGFFRAGCNRYIGRAVLEFTDILPNESDGTPRSSCFSKRLTVEASSGFYSVRLPARKYKVEVVGFVNPFYPNSTDSAYIHVDSLKTYFNQLLSKDSITRDITLADVTLNLTYEYKPVLAITQGLNLFCAPPPVNNFAIFRQGVPDSFRVKVYQGPVSHNCPVTDTINKIKLYTSIDTVDMVARLHEYKPAISGTVIRLKGGTPFTVSPYTKPFYIQYNDRLARSVAELSRNVVVTGLKADTATFTTVSPEVPMLILHDPPGDGSSSSWQSNSSFSSSLRMYAASGTETNAWLEAKIGAKFEAGIGVSTESSVWGSINANLNVTTNNTTSNETINTISNSQLFGTSNNQAVIGRSGDVYIGAAMNLIYAGAYRVDYDADSCKFDITRQLIVANQGFATQYVYSESHIRETVMPSLLALSRNPGNTAEQTARYVNQASVWQQILDNNEENKSKAKFIRNVSFDGSTAQSGTVTTSKTKTSTVEFGLAINPTLAVELGFEVAGSGVSGGLNCTFKTETGQSSSNTTMQETVISYTIQDDDPGDYYTVNIKQDPVYGTPVFDMIAGASSCPQEAGTQPRDDMEIYAPVPVQQNIPANDTAYFWLYLANTSQSGEARTYRVKFDQSSNTGAAISIGGSQATADGIEIPVAHLAQVPVLVGVKRLAPGAYSFEGLRFIATDNCGSNTGNVSKSVTISANFANGCSNITMASPVNGWQANSASGNIIPIEMTGYNIANLNFISLQYARAGSNSWTTAFTKSKAQLNAAGHTENWDITNIPDTLYDIRLMLTCGATNIYSQRASGLIDRKAPLLLGNPHPTDDNYVNGDLIGFTYNELINTNNLNDGRVTMTRLSNGLTIPITVTGYQNQIVIVPTTSITAYTGETIRIIVTGMSDVYGNVKSIPDTSYFLVGSTNVATGANALTVSIATPVVYKNSDSIIKVFFKLPVARPFTDTRVNYTLSGTARLGIDYTVSYARVQPYYTNCNGSQGAISIGKDSLSTVLRIKPISDTGWTADKTIIISLSEGGDYGLGTTTSVLGKITSEDSVAVYTFTGNGNFSEKSNWLNGKMPLTTLMAPKEIIINPITGTCTLNQPLTIRPGAKLTIKQDKQLIVPGFLKVKN